jgi:hypothetical protein
MHAAERASPLDGTPDITCGPADARRCAGFKPSFRLWFYRSRYIIHGQESVMKSIPIKILSAIVAYCLVVVSVCVAKPVTHKRKTAVVPIVTAAHWPLNSSPDLEALIKSGKVINTAKLEEFTNEYWAWTWLRREVIAFNQGYQTRPLDIRPEEAADGPGHYKLLELNDQSTYIFRFTYPTLTFVTFYVIAYGTYNNDVEVHVCRIEGGSMKQCWSGEIDGDQMHLRSGALDLAQPQWVPLVW